MTTIAYRDGIMAADRRLSSGNWIAGENTKKLYRLSDGAVAGITASGSHWIRRWLDWYEDERPQGARLDLKGECYVLVAYPDGKLLYFCGDSYNDNSQEPFECTGSGWVPARAAMLMGADARRAVEIAGLCNGETGPIIDVMKIVE